jgi:hypothetical protein
VISRERADGITSPAPCPTKVSQNFHPTEVVKPKSFLNNAKKRREIVVVEKPKTEIAAQTARSSWIEPPFASTSFFTIASPNPLPVCRRRSKSDGETVCLRGELWSNRLLLTITRRIVSR